MVFISNQCKKEWEERHELAMICTELRLTEPTYIVLSAYHLGGLEALKCEAFQEAYRLAKKEVWQLSNDKINQLQDFFNKIDRSL